MVYSSPDAWLTEGRIWISEVLERALRITAYGGTVQRLMVLDRLASSLGLDADRLGPASYWFLEAVLEPLEQELAKGPGTWVSDIETERQDRIARKVVEECGVEQLLQCFEEFGWNRTPLHLGKDAQVTDVEPALQKAFIRRLKEQLRKSFDQWRKANAWPGNRRPA